MADLTFIRSGVRGAEMLEAAVADADVSGLMVSGSVARGDAAEGSDLDLYVLLKKGCSRDFYTGNHSGILLEIKYADFDKALDKLNRNSMEMYNYLDGHILYDPEGLVQKLSVIATENYNGYRSSRKDKKETAHWLLSAKTKMEAAAGAGDSLKASFVASTTSYKILEAFWLVNHKPMPPSGGVLAYLKDLEHGAALLEDWMSRYS
ncbi:nucleotidyltransferase domain-containing protein [Paenibacillus sp. GCM10012303]|uniref:nucleotidyltransferase domain-containing protein n=1 Tax=Paenibacillus sp. GCM10012303 TaxID=3317340 RepID=UPI00360F58AA